MQLILMLLRIYRFIFKHIFTYIVMYTCGSYIKPLTVYGFSIITKNTILGKNVNFNGMKISGSGKVSIGDNFHSGKKCSMITQNHNFDKGTRIPYDSSYIYDNIVIKDNVWLGNNVLILSGVTIGEGVVIQAGSVVVSDIPDFAIAGGHPAKVFKYRDIAHYQKLKELKMFH